MKTVIEMFHEAGEAAGWKPGIGNKLVINYLTHFAELVRADEREGTYKRRGTLMFSPYTGTPRHPSDVASDPHGILMLDPEQPLLRGLKPTGGIEP